jgi:sporulation-control protein spo0M
MACFYIYPTISDHPACACNYRADRRRRGDLRRWLQRLLREDERQARLGTADREVDA